MLFMCLVFVSRNMLPTPSMHYLTPLILSVCIRSFISELMKCAACVCDLAEVKAVLEESEVTGDSAPNLTEEQQ